MQSFTRVCPKTALVDNYVKRSESSLPPALPMTLSLLVEVEIYAKVFGTKSWLENAGLLLEEHKTEVVLITR